MALGGGVVRGVRVWPGGGGAACVGVWAVVVVRLGTSLAVEWRAGGNSAWCGENVTWIGGNCAGGVVVASIVAGRKRTCQVIAKLSRRAVGTVGADEHTSIVLNGAAVGKLVVFVALDPARGEPTRT